MVAALAMVMGLSGGTPATQVPALAVLPLDCPGEPEYGVFVADRLAYELAQHAYFVPLERRRFDLVETDTLSFSLVRQLPAGPGRLPDGLAEAIREHVTARFLLTGDVVITGHRTLRLKFVDLDEGSVCWAREVVDDPSWAWTRSSREMGDISAEEVRRSLGYSAHDTPVPPLGADELPRNVLLQPLYCPGYDELAADYRFRLREGLTRDGLFTLLAGEVAEGRDGRCGPRLGPVLRRRASEVMEADAVLCGSLRVLGKENTVYTMVALLRMVEVPSGRVLWAGKAGGQRVWRWDKLTDITRGVVAQLSQDLAQFGARAAETALSGLLADAVDGPGWCAVGEAYLQRGLLAQAEDAFERALNYPDARARSYNGLGEIYIRRPDEFNRAVTQFQKATQVDPGYLEPYANLARGYLERGITTGIEYAEKAIAIDSSFSLPYRVLGDWHQAHEEDRKAAAQYERYLRLEPDDVEVAARLGRSLIRLEDYAAVDRLIAPVYRAHPEASDLLPVLAYRFYQVLQFVESDRYYRRFLAQTSRGERENYEALGVLLAPADQQAYAALAEAERERYRSAFWLERDPDLTTEANERLLEHYGRVWVARRDYSDRAYPWDQRGDVYVRYGKPDYRARSGWIPRLLPQDVQQIKERMYADLYGEPTDEELVGPVFPVRSDRGIAVARLEEESPNRMLTPIEQAELSEMEAMSDDAARAPLSWREERESYAPVTLQNDNSIVPWESWVYVDIAGGLVVDFTEEPGGSTGYDFAPLPPIAPSNMKSDVRLAEYAPAISYQHSVSEKADAYDAPVRPPLKTLSHDFTDFRGQDGASRVDVAYAVPAELLGRRRVGGKPAVALQRAVAFADSSYSRVYRQSRRVQFAEEEAQDGRVIDVLQNEVPPGLYHMTVSIMDLATGRAKTIKRDVSVERYGETDLQLSDIVVAERVSDYAGAVRFRRGPLEVMPNPGRRFSRDKNLAIYYEIYNLKQDAYGQTKYRVAVSVRSIDRRSTARRIMTGRELPGVTFGYDQVGNRAWERRHVALNLNELEPGPSLVSVTVEDMLAGRRATKEAEFHYGDGAEEASP